MLCKENQWTYDVNHLILDKFLEYWVGLHHLVLMNDQLMQKIVNEVQYTLSLYTYPLDMTDGGNWPVSIVEDSLVNMFRLPYCLLTLL